jgi:mRNA-degrading endonuclease RelE of RelBE toxin-antitoxin system
MRHRATPRFWEHYRRLPTDVRDLADKNFQLLQSNPRHPSLQLKKVGNVWSARVGLAHRALAVEDGEDFLWVWIGSHDDYDRLIRGR